LRNTRLGAHRIYDRSADDFLRENAIAKHVVALSRLQFKESKASVSFDAYVLHSYGEGTI